MDANDAQRLFESLAGKEVGGFRVEGFLGHGNTAIVVRAIRSGAPVALKVLDPGLVARRTEQRELARIERALTLREKTHPNLVKTLDGGRCAATGCLFIAMEELEGGRILRDCFQEVPRNQIWRIMSGLASACEFLETMNLAHRDIKPANVFVADDTWNPLLLDLGVLRVLPDSDLTDGSEGPLFLATNRYSPPELLTREEDPSVEGWRAVTFYQLGGVLYDLIERRQLFEDSKPTGRLLRDIFEVVPLVAAVDIDPELRRLAQLCLSKDPRLRLRALTWASFTKSTISEDEALDRLEAELGAFSPSADIRSWRELLEGSLGAGRGSQIAAAADLLRGLVQANPICPPARITEDDATREVVVHFGSNSKVRIDLELVLVVSVEAPDETGSVHVRALAVACRPRHDVVLAEASQEVFFGAVPSNEFSIAMVRLVYSALVQLRRIQLVGDEGQIVVDPSKA